MMPSRIAALYDIHANLPALEAVLEDVRRARVDEVVVGGDVLPGPMPVDTIAALRSLDVPVRYIMGNGDREVLEHARGVETDWYRRAQESWRVPVAWTATQLTRADVDVVASWPPTCRAQIEAIGRVLFCHATPRNDTDCFTRLTRDEVLLPLFNGLDAEVVVCGHTHMPFERVVGSVRVVNAGSIGMPFGAPLAYWLLLGPRVELRRTAYDLAAAAARIRSTPYPQAEHFAHNHVLHPPSEESMLPLFTEGGPA
jgi:putative phosphoesterase